MLRVLDTEEIFSLEWWKHTDMVRDLKTITQLLTGFLMDLQSLTYLDDGLHRLVFFYYYYCINIFSNKWEAHGGVKMQMMGGFHPTHRDKVST